MTTLWDAVYVCNYVTISGVGVQEEGVGWNHEGRSAGGGSGVGWGWGGGHADDR